MLRFGYVRLASTEATWMTQRLFVYGTLAPGRANEHVLADVPGTWELATVRGRLLQQGWGAEVGFPGIVLDEDGPEVHGMLFSSAAGILSEPSLEAARRPIGG